MPLNGGVQSTVVPNPPLHLLPVLNWHRLDVSWYWTALQSGCIMHECTHCPESVAENSGIPPAYTSKPSWSTHFPMWATNTLGLAGDGGGEGRNGASGGTCGGCNEGEGVGCGDGGESMTMK